MIKSLCQTRKGQDEEPVVDKATVREDEGKLVNILYKPKQAIWMILWSDILKLPEVKYDVYDHGNNHDTVYSRKLVTVITISSSKTLPQAVAMGERFVESIANRPFEMEFSASGKATTRIGNRNTPRDGMKSRNDKLRVKVDDNVTVGRQNGNTTYIFNNLNVYRVVIYGRSTSILRA